MRITYSAIISSLFFFVSSFILPVWANDHQHHVMAHTHSLATTAAIYQSNGMIKKWDTNSVTIAHAPIAALKWPAMTMVFTLPSRDEITPLPVNTSVSFSFIQHADGYTLTTITPQQP
ncbi:copper-binding protein [Pectobacterium cacticida]|uniref:copper-binding protein n=1 Tax=Pectobacterium cacticida TaxID=69221 RepID=UPI003987C7AE